MVQVNPSRAGVVPNQYSSDFDEVELKADLCSLGCVVGCLSGARDIGGGRDG